MVRLKTHRLLLVTGLIAGLGFVNAHASFSIYGLGDLPGNIFESEAVGVSADGSVVVGYSGKAYSNGFGNGAFRWTLPTGMVDLGDFAGGTNSMAYACSLDGSVIVGLGLGTQTQAAKWFAGDPNTYGLGYFGPNPSSSQAFACSSTGAYAAGVCHNDNGDQAFRLEPNGNMSGLGFLGTDNASMAFGMSGDGTVVTGYSGSSIGSNFKAFRWTFATGMQSIQPVVTGLTSQGNGVSGDGNYIVGTWSTNTQIQAFRWDAVNGMVGLGYLPGSGQLISEAYGTNSDGSIVVGRCDVGFNDRHAYIWDAVNGMQDIKQLLVNNGINMDAWSLTFARAVSADGKTVVGYGYHEYSPSDFRIEAFAARIPYLSGPVGVADAYTMDKATSLTVSTANGVLTNDINAGENTSTAQPVANPGHGTLTLSGDGSFQYTPDPAFVGNDTFTYKVVRGTYQSAVTTVTITVLPVLSSLAFNPTSVTAGSSSTGTVTLNAAAPTGGTVVKLTSGSSVIVVPATMTVAAGSTTGTFTANTLSVSSSYTRSVTATLNVTSKVANLTINPVAVQSLAINPGSIVGGNSVTGTVTLNASVLGSTPVALSNNGASDVTVPPTVVVNTGSNTANFTITTGGVLLSGQRTVTATLYGSSQSATVTLNPASLVSLTVNPSTVVGSFNTTATVTLNGQAPPLTGAVMVGSNNGSLALNVPLVVTVPPGQSSTTFTIGTAEVSTSYTRYASVIYAGVTKTAAITLVPGPNVSSISVSGSGSTRTVTLTMDSPALSGGAVVQIYESTPPFNGDFSCPPTVTVPEGQTSTTFNITINTPGMMWITAKYKSETVQCSFQ